MVENEARSEKPSTEVDSTMPPLFELSQDRYSKLANRPSITAVRKRSSGAFSVAGFQPCSNEDQPLSHTGVY